MPLRKREIYEGWLVKLKREKEEIFKSENCKRSGVILV